MTKFISVLQEEDAQATVRLKQLHLFKHTKPKKAKYEDRQKTLDKATALYDDLEDPAKGEQCYHWLSQLTHALRYRNVTFQKTDAPVEVEQKDEEKYDISDREKRDGLEEELDPIFEYPKDGSRKKVFVPYFEFEV